MKIPKPKRLVEWYRKMLDRGKSDNVVYDYRVSVRRARREWRCNVVCVAEFSVHVCVHCTQRHSTESVVSNSTCFGRLMYCM